MRPLLVAALIAFAIWHDWPGMPRWQHIYLVVALTLVAIVYAFAWFEWFKHRKEVRDGGDDSLD